MDIPLFCVFLKNFKSNFLLSLIITAVASAMLSISIALHFTDFLFLSRSDKLFLLGIMWLVITVVGLLLILPSVKRLMSVINGHDLRKLLIISACFSILLMGLFYNLPVFPKYLSLEIRPVESSQNKNAEQDISLISILRQKLPNENYYPITLSEIEINGGWLLKDNYLVFSSVDGEIGSARYTSYVPGDVFLEFNTGAGQGAVEIIYNNKRTTLELANAASESIIYTVSMPNTWQAADRTRKLILAAGVVSDIVITFIVLVALFSAYRKMIKRITSLRGLTTLRWVTIISLGMVIISNQMQQEIVFSDPALEQGFRIVIDKPEGKIYNHQLLSIIELDLSSLNIEKLDGVEAARNLRVLNLSGNRIQDLSPISRLKKLQQLNLTGNQISDLSPLSENKSLTKLILRQNKITDISPIEKMINLDILDLSRNHIINIASVSTLNNLKELNLRQNQVKDISVVAGLSTLTYLNLHSNSMVEDISPLENLTSLQELILRNIPLGDQLKHLSKHTALQNLNIRNCGVTDFEPLAVLLQQGALQDDKAAESHATVNIIDNYLSDEISDPYSSLRPYWENVTYRYPYILPYYDHQVQAPKFSHASGFYSESIELTLRTDEQGGRILYTLDGSLPSYIMPDYQRENTFTYSYPITIKDKSGEPNQFAGIEASKVDSYLPPNTIPKGTIIRALVVNADGEPSPVVTNFYLVEDEIGGRYTFPVVSITSPPEGLFSDEMGIYVPGDLYQGKNSKEPLIPANYTQRGSKWERPANIQLFNPQGERLLEQDIGLRIHGYGSRRYVQKSLRLYANGLYGSQGLFQFDFFPQLNNRINNTTVDTFESLILRTSGASSFESKMLRDIIFQDLLVNTGLDIQGNYPAVVFLNGEYWGIYNLRTRYDVKYFENYYSIAPEDLVICEKGQAFLFFGKPGDEELYKDLLRMIDENYETKGFKFGESLSDPVAYEKLSERMDIENYIDYYTSQLYSSNRDWPASNIMFWKKKVDPLNPGNRSLYGHDGKWRWMVIDVDYSFMRPDWNGLIWATADGKQETYLFNSLLQNREYVTQFINRFADMLNTNFKEDVVIAHVDQVESTYLPEMPANIERWGAFEGSVETWMNNIDGIRDFARLRPNIQRQQLVEFFSLAGTARLTIRTDPIQGYVRINTIDIQKGTPGVKDPATWSGMYFQGVPFTVTAIPREGYHFSHWEGLATGNLTDASVELLLTGDLSLEAVFIR